MVSFSSLAWLFKYLCPVKWVWVVTDGHSVWAGTLLCPSRGRAGPTPTAQALMPQKKPLSAHKSWEQTLGAGKIFMFLSKVHFH